MLYEYTSLYRNEAPRVLFLRITQITTGAPKIDVTTLMGNICSLPGIWAITSQKSKTRLPVKNTDGINLLWSLVEKTALVRCGTAIPIKAIGPV